MNYREAEPSRYQLKIYNFLIKDAFIDECPTFTIGIPRVNGAIGGDLTYSKPKKGISELRNLSPCSLRRFSLRVQKMNPFNGGLLSLSDPEGQGIKPLLIKFYHGYTINLQTVFYPA